MLPEKIQASLEDALDWLSEISEISEALLMATEQLESKPDQLPARLHFLLSNCYGALILAEGEIKVCLSFALSKIDRFEATNQPVGPSASVHVNGELPKRS